MIDGVQIFSGLTIDFIYRREDTIYNKNTNAFEAWNGSNYANYLNRTAEQGASGYYILERPFSGVASISVIQHVDGTIGHDIIKGSAENSSGRNIKVELTDKSIR